MKRLIIIPLLLLSLLSFGQGRYPFYRGAGVAEEEPSGPPDLLNSDTWSWWIMDSDHVTHADGIVSAVNDESSNNRDLSQSNANYRPYFANDSVTFNGSDEYLFYASGTTVIPQPLTIYCVVNRLTAAAGPFVIIYGSSASIEWSGTALRVKDGATLTSATSLTLNEWAIVTVVLSGENSLIQVNGNTATTGNAGTLGMNYNIGIAGDDGYINCSVREVIIRTVADDATDRSDVIDYLNAKYSIY